MVVQADINGDGGWAAEEGESEDSVGGVLGVTRDVALGAGGRLGMGPVPEYHLVVLS